MFKEMQQLRQMLDDAGIEYLTNDNWYVQRTQVMVGECVYLSAVLIVFNRLLGQAWVKYGNVFDVKPNQTAEQVFEWIMEELGK